MTTSVSSSSSSTINLASAIRSESIKSDNTAPSSLASSSSVPEERHTPRGRSDTKDVSNQKHICVVAFLIKEENVDEASAIRKIQDIRRQFDQAHRRWLPHITLIPPFMIPFTSQMSSGEESNGGPSDGEGDLSAEANNVSIDHVGLDLEEISMKLQKVCNDYNHHKLSLGEIGHFPLRRYRTIHLRPLPGTCELFQEMQKNLEKAIPQAIESSRGNLKKKKQKEAYKPHLTLGQSYSEDMHNRINKLANSVLIDGPIKVTVDKIQLMTKPSHQSGPYDIYREFPLQTLKAI